MTFHSNRRALLGSVASLFLLRSARGAEDTAGPRPVEVKKRDFVVPVVDAQATIVTRYRASALQFQEDLGEGVNLTMALIPGGSFLMGSDAEPVAFTPAEQPMRRVQIAPFALGIYPVTRKQWKLVAEAPEINEPIFVRYESSEDTDNLPVDLLPWREAEEFCARLAKLTGRPYRLPSEAEWEYACRAGTTTNYHFGDGISRELANYNDGVFRPLALTAVGALKTPNRFGLHDMHGNVHEHCADLAHEDYEGAPTDGRAWNEGDQLYRHMARGGLYLANARVARSAARQAWTVNVAFSGLGLRVALDWPEGSLDPAFAADGVVHAASRTAGPVVPGGIVAIVGAGLGPRTGAVERSVAEDGTIATELAGTRVLFDGVAAPLLSVAADGLVAMAPFGIAPKSAIEVTVEVNGQTSIPAKLTVEAANPALFTADGTGRGLASARNEDGALHAMANPARQGSKLSFYCTGAGAVSPAIETGKVIGGERVAPVLPVELTIGGVAAAVEFFGCVPGEVGGLVRVEVRVPASIPVGLNPVALRVGGVPDPGGVSAMIA